VNFEINSVLPSLLLVFVEKGFNLPIHPPSRQLSLTLFPLETSLPKARSPPDDLTSGGTFVSSQAESNDLTVQPWWWWWWPAKKKKNQRNVSHCPCI
jgi:hypothetical protein